MKRNQNGQYYLARPAFPYSSELYTSSINIHQEILLLWLNGKLQLAPLKGLQIGIGTGQYAADKYPGAKVIGMDIRSICINREAHARRRLTI